MFWATVVCRSSRLGVVRIITVNHLFPMLGIEVFARGIQPLTEPCW
jgi:hypothetical protein